MEGKGCRGNIGAVRGVRGGIDDGDLVDSSVGVQDGGDGEVRRGVENAVEGRGGMLAVVLYIVAV